MQYYSERNGKPIKRKGRSLKDTKESISSIIDIFTNNGYWQLEFGYDCVDNGYYFGNKRISLEAFMDYEFEQEGSLSICQRFEKCNEEEFFDILEFLYKYCSKPIEGSGYYHSFNNCGLHDCKYDNNSQKMGREEFRQEINIIIALYQNGFQMNENGQIMSMAQNGFKPLIDAKIKHNNQAVQNPVEKAKEHFFRHNATLSDRKNAVRDLADALEHIRKDVKQVLTKKDESELFDILNNFGIRHNDTKQKINYDEDIFYSWLFYHYLAAFHACDKLIERNKAKS